MDYPASLGELSNANESTLSAPSELISNVSWMPSDSANFTNEFPWQNDTSTDVFFPNNATEASVQNATSDYSWTNITKAFFDNFTSDSSTTNSDILMDAVDPNRQRFQAAIDDLNRNPAYNNFNGDPNFGGNFQNSPLIDQQTFYPTSYNPDWLPAAIILPLVAAIALTLAIVCLITRASRLFRAKKTILLSEPRLITPYSIHNVSHYDIPVQVNGATQFQGQYNAAFDPGSRPRSKMEGRSKV
ncbi:hypothetical protein RvY_16188 [Ramazzottius varieornatus]|uniref:Uncharacterized protein n=1 Tax=Ramazzottius varieornatus TaxID=947166 RepID=A0A1D1VYJ3_RAMVA|nr:hypothetical protein RvY_16188 [Ramazzottius varieornatus]